MRQWSGTPPPYIFEVLGLRFDLDPCYPTGKDLPWIPVKDRLREADDGLTAPWHGLVWLNPPYGSATGRWLKRLQSHGEGVALVFARPDTAWFQETVKTASGVLFIRKRVRFINSQTLLPSENSPGAGSCLIGFGDTAFFGLQQASRKGMGLLMRASLDR